MGDDNTLSTSSAPEEVKLGFIVVPLLLASCLVVVVFLYRCYSHRRRRHRLAQEHQAELREMAGGMDVAILVDVRMGIRSYSMKCTYVRSMSYCCYMEC